MKKTKMELGKEYGFAGYKWVPVEINEDRQVAVMQSFGVTAGPWPGYSMEKFGDGNYYGKDIVRQDISEYDDKTINLAEQIKPIAIASSTGLYLPSYKNIEDNSVWKAALAKAADNYSSFGAFDSYVWLDFVNRSSSAWCVSQNGNVGDYYQSISFIVAPFFTLDLSKVEVKEG